MHRVGIDYASSISIERVNPVTIATKTVSALHNVLPLTKLEALKKALRALDMPHLATEKRASRKERRRANKRLKAQKKHELQSAQKGEIPKPTPKVLQVQKPRKLQKLLRSQRPKESEALDSSDSSEEEFVPLTPKKLKALDITEEEFVPGGGKLNTERTLGRYNFRSSTHREASCAR